MASDLIRKCIEAVINDSFEQKEKERGDFRLRYLIKTSTGVVWADHAIETGYEDINSSIRKRLEDRGVKFILYYSLSQEGEEFCSNIKNNLEKVNCNSAINFGIPESMGKCYCLVLKQQ